MSRFGLVGAGAIAQSYVEVFAGSDHAELVAVADVRFDAAQALADRAGATRVFASAEAMIAAGGIDGVVVSVPPAHHGAVVRAAAAAGFAVLCEKPVAQDFAAGVELLTYVRSAGVPFAMATKFRYCADVLRARDLVADGAIGTPLLIENAFTSRVDMRNRWNTDPAMSGGGVLMDNGTHSVDLLSFVMGPIEAVLAMEGPRPDGMVVEDAARLQLRLADGVLGHVDLSWSIDKSLEDFLHVYGSTGELRVGWKRSQWRNFGTDWQTFGEGYVKAPAMRGPVEALVDRMNGGTGQYLTDGMTAAAVIDAAYRSLASGTWAVVGRPCGAISMQP